MELKRIIFITITNLFIVFGIMAQQFADKAYYLVDSLVIKDITETDQFLLDSCLKVYHNAKQDTDKVNAIKYIVEESWDDNVWPKYNMWVYQYAKEKVKSSNDSIWKIYLSGTLNNIGFLLKQQGNIDSALNYYNKSLALYVQLNDKTGQAAIYNNIGVIYDDKGAILTALEYYLKGLKLQEELDDKLGLAYSYNNIGFIYKNQDELDIALDYLTKSLMIREEIGDKKGMADSYSYIGSVYTKKNEPSKALEFYKKGLNLREEIGDKQGLAESYDNLGTTFEESKDLLQALDYYQKGLELRKSIGNKQGMATSYNEIGVIMLKIENVESAKENAIKSIEIAKEIGSPSHIMNAAKLYFKVLKQEGNYKEALNMHELYVQMRDSIKNDETQKAAIRQQTKYEFEKNQLVREQNEKEQSRLNHEKLQRRNNLQYSIILVAILVVFGVVLSLGFISVSSQLAEGLIFFAFLIFFEFLLILSDPYIETITDGEPAYKLLANALLAALIFPAHSFFERTLKKRLIMNRKKAV